ncbi:MAG: MFS transporter [Candidatus Heimdallarchaeota archaeon]|nr:MFS transporter [Candidatus Heimdallarchaeota archaeon]MCK4876540.1 MFS transporter [Candidatus Heimdallarchaeota archaeon]
MSNQNDNHETLSQAEEKKPNAFSLLKSWDFSALFLGGFISNIGSYFTSIAIMFFALEITENLTVTEATRLIALMTTFALIPVFILGPIAGVLVDKFDRKKVMIFADLFAAVAVIALIFSSKMWHLYLIFFMNSSVRQFFYPAKTASIPRIVKQEQLLSANGFIQTSANISRLIGPLLAGFLIGFFGLRIAFIIDAGTFVFSAIMIFAIRRDLKPKDDGEKISVRNVTIGLREGFKIAFGDKVISFVIILFSFTIFLIGMVDPLIVPYMNFQFGLGEKEFGMLMSFSAVSGIIAAVILSIKGQLKKKLTFMSATIVVASFCLAFIALAAVLPGGYVWLYVGFAFVGMINVGFSIPFSTLLQSTIKNENLGKVSGVIDTVITGASLLASTIAAALAGVVSISIIFGLVAGLIAVAGVVGLFYIKATKLDKQAQIREEEMKHLKELEEIEKQSVGKEDDFERIAEITLKQIKVEERKDSPQPSID